jgi:hypothetical protein
VHHFKVDVGWAVGVFASEKIPSYFAQRKEVFERKFFGFVIG